MIEFNNLFQKLKQSEVLFHYWHLRTDSFAQHKALGRFYEEMNGLADSLAESCMGKHGSKPAIPPSITLGDKEDPVSYLKDLGGMLDMYITMYKNDLELQNTVLEIRDLVNTTLYLLTLK